jgi:TonB-linked SusC/RagA family outer membrane protein
MKYIKIGILVCSILALLPIQLWAQQPVKDIMKAVIVDTKGNPVNGAVVSNEKLKLRTKSNVNGEFTINIESGGLLKISAEGFVDKIIEPNSGVTKIELTNINRTIIPVAFGKADKKDILGGISSLDVQQLMKKNYTTYSLDNLSAYINGYSGNIWGMDSYVVLVDGVPREATNVSPSEIDQISVMKGVGALALYGSRGAKGVISITTKKGQNKDQEIKFRANSGIYVPKSYPEYLSSGEYMTYYNEARANDGLTPKYSAEDIYNYSSHKNIYRYPDVDYYSSDYLKKFYNRTDATAEISGGNDRTKFYTNIGYQHSNSLLNVGESKNDKNIRFNLRGNIDMKLNDFISTNVNAVATYYNSRGAFGNYWSKASTLRPNRFSPLIPVSAIEANDANSMLLVNNSMNLIDGKYLLGGTSLDATNPFGDMYAAGYSKYTNRQFQVDANININLVRVLKGLTFNTEMAVDYSDTYNESFNNTYATYEALWNNYSGDDKITSLKKYNEDKISGVQNLSGSWQRQTMFFSAQFNYNRTFNQSHNVSALLLAHGYQLQESAIYHRTSNSNLGLQAAYNYQQKYYVDFTAAAVHSSKLAPGKRNAISPTLSLGWRLTNESFMPKNDVLNDLKLTASAGVLNTDLEISNYYMYEQAVTQSSGTWWGWKDGVTLQSTDALRSENKNLTFAKRKEFNAGLEASLFDNKLTLAGSYYMSEMTNLPIQANTLYPSYFYTYYPSSSFLPYVNYNSDKRTGFDVNVNYKQRVGKTEIQLGVVASYYETKATKRSEFFADEYQKRQGKPKDAIFGLESEGFFTDAEDIATHATQAFGTVKPGDIKYKDQNGDGVVDDKDEISLGRGGWYGAPWTIGTNLTIKWKNLTFFALGTGGFGAYGMKNSSYYWVYGDSKYSAVVRNRWTESTKETATFPRLTTLSGDNNFRSSSFWLYKTDRFNLAKIQLTYDLPTKLFVKSPVQGVSVYVSGSDLLTIAKERKHMEMNIGSSPQCRFYNLGMKVDF